MQDKLRLSKDATVPNHIAIIPDGNRRWARSKGLYTLEGHKAGFEAAVKVCRTAREWGVHTVTLWGFSTENWDRSEKEVNYLMRLYEKLIRDFLKEAKENKVRIYHLGRKDRLPKVLIKKIRQAEDETCMYTKYIMNICLDYGGHDDILRAVQKIVGDKVKPENITKELMEKYIDTHGQPYPYVDLMIRTSGEQRTSGFLLWESPYTEYYWENSHFPDFTPEKLKNAILDYSRRRRRFGGNDQEKHLEFAPEMITKFELAWWRLGKIPAGTRFRDYAINHIVEQYGLSKKLAKEAAKYFVAAIIEGNENKWSKSKKSIKAFYVLVKEELKLAFEPKVVASLQVRLWQDLQDEKDIEKAIGAEDIAKELYAEVYRISIFQAAKLAHLRVLATVEKNLALAGMGEQHWDKAEDYLYRFYKDLKERVA